MGYLVCRCGSVVVVVVVVVTMQRFAGFGKVLGHLLKEFVLDRFVVFVARGRDHLGFGCGRQVLSVERWWMQCVGPVHQRTLFSRVVHQQRVAGIPQGKG